MSSYSRALSRFQHRNGGLSAEVSALAEQVSDLAQLLTHRGERRIQQVAHGAGELAGELFHQLTPVARGMARQARHAGRAVQQDPVPAMVAVATFALVASLFMRRQ